MRIFIVSYFSPPCSQVGSFRIGKFLKYLSREKNVKIKLFTPYESEYKYIDYSRIEWDQDKVIISKSKTISKNYGIKEEGARWLPFLFFDLLRALLKDKPDFIFFTEIHLCI